MKRGFIATEDAQSDLFSLWQYVARAKSERKADLVLARIYDECAKLAKSPGIGHFREDILDTRHRFWSVWSYLIVYRWETKPIEVLGVVHGARELRALLATRGR